MFADLTSLINSLLNFILASELNFFVSLGILAIAVIIGVLYVLRSALRAASQSGKAFHKTILLIRVPKEKKSEGTQQSQSAEDNINQIREQVAVADTLFSAVAGLKGQKGFANWLKGRNDHIAFEIVVKDNKISWYAAVPDKLKNFLEKFCEVKFINYHIAIPEKSDANYQKTEEFLENKKIVVLGRGKTAGGPIVELLESHGFEVVVITRETKNPTAKIQKGDVVISATGVKNIINSSNVKKWAYVIGVGVGREIVEGRHKIYGDINEEEISKIAKLYCPTIGGIGPLTIVSLLENVVESARRVQSS